MHISILFLLFLLINLCVCFVPDVNYFSLRRIFMQFKYLRSLTSTSKLCWKNQSQQKVKRHENILTMYSSMFSHNSCAFCGVSYNVVRTWYIDSSRFMTIFNSTQILITKLVLTFHMLMYLISLYLISQSDVCAKLNTLRNKVHLKYHHIFVMQVSQLLSMILQIKNRS